MENSSTSPAPKTGHRYWMPFTGLVIGFIAFVVGFFLPSDYPPFVSVMVITISVYFVLLITGLWLLFFSRFPWLRRLTIMVSVFVIRYALIREVDYSGDVVPRIVWRWEKHRYTALEENRAGHSKKKVQFSTEPSQQDYPGYRNVKTDAVAEGPELALDWRTTNPKLVWKQPSGGGYAAFAIAADLAVTIEQRRDNETVAAYHASTGQELWTYSWKALQYDAMGGEGPQATPAIDKGKVYALGGTGKFVCLEAQSGKLLWQKDLLEGNNNLQWGMSGSPLIFNNLVVANPGEQNKKQLNRALRAFDKNTGNLVWSAGNNRAGYCSPMVAELLGQVQLLIFDGEEIAGYNPADGKKLWSLPWATNQGINVAQPIPLGNDKLFITSSYGTGCGLLQLKKEGEGIVVSELWHNFQLRCRFTSPVLYKNHIYGLDEGALVCLDSQTGRRAWKGERFGQGQLLRQGNVLLIQAENGDLAMVEAAPEAFKLLGRFKALAGEKTWNCPTLARGFAFVRNHYEMACYDLRK